MGIKALKTGSDSVIVTTSWDDGHKCDIQMAQLLQAYGLSATFYIAPANREFGKQELLTEQEIRQLSEKFEIGSHTTTHPRLPKIPKEKAIEEIRDSKLLLERLTGKAVSSFCYPGGAYTAIHPQLVKDAGYRYARTVRRHAFNVGDPYEAPTSIHTYDHLSDLWRVVRFAGFRPARMLNYRHWDSLGQAMFDHVAEVGGVYHIWGHSWEIEKRNEWGRLERVFKHISSRPGVKYVTNGQLA
jgi:peptidoglycan-N-acetylglucosamine deacetylase